MVLGYEVQVRIVVMRAKLPDEVLKDLVANPKTMKVELVVSRLETIKAGTLGGELVSPEDIKKAKEALDGIEGIENAEARMNRGRSLSERIEEVDRIQGSIHPRYPQP